MTQYIYPQNLKTMELSCWMALWIGREETDGRVRAGGKSSGPLMSLWQ